MRSQQFRFEFSIWLLRGALVSAFALVVWSVLPQVATANTGNAGEVASTKGGQISNSSSLPPDVESFIAGTFFEHTEEFPDPNESVPVLKDYMSGMNLVQQNRVDEAVALFSATVKRNSEARHAHAGLGYALWQRYSKRGSKDDLRSATGEFLQAAAIGMKFGRVRYTYQLAIGLAQLGDRPSMDQVFAQALALDDRRYLTSLDYARGKAVLRDPETEKWFKQAMALRPEGNVDALAYYTEWLLDWGREADVVQLISPDEHVEYLHLLRAVALERLGRLQEAQRDYEIFAPFSALSLAPAKYRIANSQLQQKITFQGINVPQSVPCDGYNDLAQLIECESSGESEGGQRAVGWTVRTRVFMGALQGCVAPIDNSGSTLDCKYTNVIYQAGQFTPTCGRPPGATPQHVRYDVYYGLAPDPTIGYCPAGSYSGDPCSGTVHCNASTQWGASAHGPMRFYSTTGSCTTGGQYSCLSAKGKICANGGYDHCFYNRP